MLCFYVIKHIINVLYIVFCTVSSVFIIVLYTISKNPSLFKTTENKQVVDQRCRNIKFPTYNIKAG